MAEDGASTTAEGATGAEDGQGDRVASTARAGAKPSGTVRPWTPRALPIGRGCLTIASTDAATRPLKTAETVARDVVHDIVRNDLQTGSSLPSEAAMLEQYGVSRESLREGLRLLEAQGLITIRRGPGGGPVVGQVDPANLGRISTLYYHLAGATYAELFDAWVLTEATLAELAARNPDRRRVREVLRPLVDDGADDETDVEKFVVMHTEFHATVASLAGNRVLELTLQTMGRIVTHHIVVNADPRDARSTIAHDHRDIARAVMAGHANKARDLMGEHIHGVAELYRTQIGDQMGDLIEWK
jgi:GntR family transcriptional regulator, transcriptional repressor for pyruvate dehydrogenase complex